MMTRDEAVRARLAALELERLYNAYRATSRAHAMVLTRIGAELEREEPDADRRRRLRRRVVGEMAVSRETDLVFRERSEQMARRIEELHGYGRP